MKINNKYTISRVPKAKVINAPDSYPTHSL